MSVSNANHWKLGLFVTIGIALSVGSLMWLGISQLQRRTRPAFFYFQESVNGLEVGSPVKFLGVEVGRVDEIFPAPDRRHIEVRAGIYLDTLEAWGIAPDHLPVSSDEQGFVSKDIRGQLKQSALTSVAFIQLGVFDAEKYPPPNYTFPIPWETIHTVPSTFRSLETGLMDALEEWPNIAKRAANILRNIDEGLQEVNFKELSADAAIMMRGVNDMAQELMVSPIVDGDSEMIAKLNATMDELRVLIGELRGREGAVHGFVTSVSGAADAIRDDFKGSDFPAAVSALEGAGNGFRETSREMTLLVEEMRSSLYQLDSTLRSVQRLTDLLTRDPAMLIYGQTPQPPFLKR